MVIRFMAQLLAWLVILGILAILGIAVVIPRIAGAVPYTVLTGSMRPTMPPGTLVVVKPTPTEQIQPGMVVTYQLRSGEPTVVTHRVVGVTAGMDGSKAFITQGDANNVADAEPVLPVQIVGAKWYSVPWIGHLNALFTNKQRQTFTYVAAGALLIYAAYMLTTGVIDTRRRRKATKTAELRDSKAGEPDADTT